MQSREDPTTKPDAHDGRRLPAFLATAGSTGWRRPCGRRCCSGSGAAQRTHLRVPAAAAAAAEVSVRVVRLHGEEARRLRSRLVDQLGRPTQYDLTAGSDERTGSLAATAAPSAKPPPLPFALPSVLSGGSPQLAGGCAAPAAAAAQAAAASCAPPASTSWKTGADGLPLPTEMPTTASWHYPGAVQRPPMLPVSPHLPGVSPFGTAALWFRRLPPNPTCRPLLRLPEALPPRSPPA